jgi:hypothetical protein
MKIKGGITMDGKQWVKLIENNRVPLKRAMERMIAKAFQLKKGIFEVILDANGEIRTKIYFSKPHQDGKTLIGAAIPIMRVYGYRTYEVDENSYQEVCENLDYFIETAKNHVEKYY